MKKFIAFVSMFLICTVSSYADNWGVLILSASFGGFIPPNQGHYIHFDNEIQTESCWWTTATSNSTANYSFIDAFKGKGISVSYDLDESTGNYAVVGANLGPQDYHEYDSLSLYIKGDTKDLSLVLAHEDTKNDDFQVYLHHFTSKDNLAGFERVSLPFSAFSQSGFGKEVAFGQAISKIKAFQFKVDTPESTGGAVIDEIIFHTDTTKPSFENMDILKVNFYPGKSFRVEIPINEKGVLNVVSNDGDGLVNADFDGVVIFGQDYKFNRKEFSGNYLLNSYMPIPEDAVPNKTYFINIDPSKVADGVGQVDDKASFIAYEVTIRHQRKDIPVGGYLGFEKLDDWWTATENNKANGIIIENDIADIGRGLKIKYNLKDKNTTWAMAGIDIKKSDLT
ncbi:secreted protein containing Carbohydrate binding family 11 domain protein, partial [Candidatus Magnetomorum sp. HK-1]